MGLFADRRPSDAEPGGPPPAESRPTDARESTVFAERLKAIDVDNTTPRQALELLAEMKRLAEKE